MRRAFDAFGQLLDGVLLHHVGRCYEVACLVRAHRRGGDGDGEILIETWQLDSVQLVPIEYHPWLDPETGLPR